MALSGAELPVAIFTCTLTQSPVTRWIFSAQVRSQQYRDIVLIGEDSVTVKHVAEDDQLVDIAYKTDFDGQIRAATVLHLGFSDHQPDSVIKTEVGHVQDEEDCCPCDILILALASKHLVFLYLVPSDDQHWTFNQSILPLPGFEQTSRQPGEHIAVDPSSCALAVAACMEEVILYSLKPPHQIRDETRRRHDDWCPVAEQQLARVDGNIDKMTFLHPSTSDREQILLLLLTVDEGIAKAVLIDWHSTHGPHYKQIHAGQALYAERELPTMLIPIQDSAFLLCTGTQVACWSKLTSGSAVGHVLDLISEEPVYPGSSPRLPLWCSWSRTHRKVKHEEGALDVYLLREDGLLFSVHVNGTRLIRMFPVDNLDLHHGGAAFASLEIDAGLDLVVVGGEMSNGKVAYVERLSPSTSSADTEMIQLGSETTAIIPNWATVIDMIPGSHRSTLRANLTDAQSMLVTSGRQPYGAITELRHGVEARLTAFTSIEDLRSFTAIWTHTNVAGFVLIVLSSPASTRVISISADGELEELDENGLLERDCRTIAVYSITAERIVQVTTRKIICVNGNDGLVQGHGSQQIEVQEIICAAHVPSASILVTVERNSNIEKLHIRRIIAEGLDRLHLPAQELPRDTICIEAFTIAARVIVCLSMSDGTIATMIYETLDQAPAVHHQALPYSDGGISLCESMLVLERPGSTLLVCGLRNGTMITFSISLERHEPLHLEQTIYLGHSAVKLSRVKCGAAVACAISGNSIFMCRPDGRGAQYLAAEPVWITDKSRPELKQGDVAACAQIPPTLDTGGKPHAYSGALLMLSGGDLLIATSSGASTTVPRQMALSGTPHRLLYANSHRCLVAASYHTQAHPTPGTKSNAYEQCVRRIWPKLEFISRRTTRPSYTYDMQPGERVNTLLEWSYRDHEDRLYSHLLVGGSHVKRSGERRGRVWFLKPSMRDWVVRGAERVFHHSFHEEVYALAMYDAVTYIALAGDKVYAKRFASATRVWEEVCAPFALASRGVYLTIEEHVPTGPLITVSTALDSLVMLHLTPCVSVAGEQSLELRPVSIAPQAESLLSHLVLPQAPSPDKERRDGRMAIVSTRYGKLVGLDCTISSPFKNGRVLFEAYLPRSMSRMLPMPPADRTAWPLQGIVSERIVACSADGAITSFILLDSTLWRRLFWLQRLVEWSEVLSPLSWRSPNYYADEIEMGRSSGRLLPIGLRTSTEDTILRTDVSRANDMHLDGDVLGRALCPEGRSSIAKVLELLSAVECRVGYWLRQHMDSEMAEIEVILDTLRSLLDGTRGTSRT